MSRISIYYGQVNCYPLNLWPLAQDLKKLIDASFNNTDRMAELLDLNILNHLTNEQAVYLAQMAWSRPSSSVKINGNGNVSFTFDHIHISPQLLYCLAVDYIQAVDEGILEELPIVELKTLTHYYED